MRALVVYESMFGNTRDVALAIADGIGTKMPVDTVEVGAAPTALPLDVSLLVVGGPTHVHGMSTPRTRANAAERSGGELVSKGPGMREWLAEVHAGSGVKAAAFDTRSNGPALLTGSAAKGAASMLRRAGVGRLEQPRSFVLDGVTGPLTDRVPVEQIEAARAWGVALAS